MSVSKAALPLKLPPSGRPSVPEVPPSGGKRGIAYNVPAYTFMFNCPKIGWAYNWGSSRSTGPISDQFMFVPMLWSDHSELTNSWNNNVELAMKTGSDAAMAFNEPDGCIDGGSCMPAPGETAWLYKTLVAPFAGRIRLGSPSVTNGDQAHKGINWFRQFMRACNAIGCPIDFVQVHWFGWCNDLGGFKRHVWEMFEAGGRRPVWVTEYSCNLGDMTPDLPERVEFLTQSLEWLDSQDWIEKYAYFMAREGDGMINSAGTGLSKLGMIYNS
ncbi:hypothetical protein P152DRAFT_387840 [Eremomyces bilateralis CBS 781.70]|uniref:Asl1-like glycosyl hydrolase catalytic domain-containing protein n=1 Tax=Eremomyces bilateralis CBS 781.70 TaxID=1392243 RepID=A0A6G1GH53_9PEZI|nr:uncharacterized protein P152DRAFT_387840 [Eremomyces bilateralis CBS 781.70]KAF1817435.1 hypothetical protein P152DRAFT_387840 [Eremomyces bilateralis CBS 781.70]